MRKKQGFTLMEVLIVVAIIGILAAIAIPSYSYHVRKGHRASAQSYMTDIATKQSQYLLDARTYASSVADLGLTEPTAVTPYYTITISASSPPPSYTITATPKAGTSQESDGVMTLTQTGAKTRGGSSGW
jgi:type IV pilus assembly protein PilE